MSVVPALGQPASRTGACLHPRCRWRFAAGGAAVRGQAVARARRSGWRAASGRLSTAPISIAPTLTNYPLRCPGTSESAATAGCVGDLAHRLAHRHAGGAFHWIGDARHESAAAEECTSDLTSTASSRLPARCWPRPECGKRRRRRIALADCGMRGDGTRCSHGRRWPCRSDPRATDRGAGTRPLPKCCSPRRISGRKAVRSPGRMIAMLPAWHPDAAAGRVPRRASRMAAVHVVAPRSLRSLPLDAGALTTCRTCPTTTRRPSTTPWAGALLFWHAFRDGKADARAARHRQPPARSPRINPAELVMITVARPDLRAAQRANPYRIGQDGRPRVLPGPGGIVLQLSGRRALRRPGGRPRRAGRLHPQRQRRSRATRRRQPGAADLRLHRQRRDGRHRPPCRAPAGRSTGKHGGVDTVLVDFPHARRCGAWRSATASRSMPTARACGCSTTAAWRSATPRRGWSRAGGCAAIGGRLRVAGDAPHSRRDHGLRARPQQRGRAATRTSSCSIRRRSGGTASTAALRRPGGDRRRRPPLRPLLSAGHVSIGCVVHSDSTVAGHGPGVVTLLTGPSRAFRLRHDPGANIARILGIRPPAPPRQALPLVMTEARRRAERSLIAAGRA